MTEQEIQATITSGQLIESIDYQLTVFEVNNSAPLFNRICAYAPNTHVSLPTEYGSDLIIHIDHNYKRGFGLESRYIQFYYLSQEHLLWARSSLVDAFYPEEELTMSYYVYKISSDGDHFLCVSFQSTEIFGSKVNLYMRGQESDKHV